MKISININKQKESKNLTYEEKYDLFNKTLNFTRSKIFNTKQQKNNDTTIKSNIVKIFTKS